ncbi:MAG: ATP-binding protein [Deltaproteobacteria bacterium]|nr:ATP-binding protein [Deltaproteobacteria bacterium]
MKALKLSTMARGIEAHLRQAREGGVDYDEFLLELTSVELQARAENRLNRRIREAKFPLIKPVETFVECSAGPGYSPFSRNCRLQLYPGT